MCRLFYNNNNTEEGSFQRRHVKMEITQRKLGQLGGRPLISLCSLSVEVNGTHKSICSQYD